MKSSHLAHSKVGVQRLPKIDYTERVPIGILLRGIARNCAELRANVLIELGGIKRNWADLDAIAQS